jgi:hypothetical protein
MNDPKREPRGTPIPGSRHVRDYCHICGEPIRVDESQLTTTITIDGREQTVPASNRCKDCFKAKPPARYTRLTAAQRHKLPETTGG